MNTTTKTSKITRKRVIIPTIAAIALLGGGAAVWAATADDVRGDERDRVAAAAVESAGGGEAVDVETSDDPGEAYEVEVRMDDGTEVDVSLDEDLNVLGQDVDDDTDASDDPDSDDRVLSDEERGSAETAALEAVGGGTVTDVEASDDAGEAYEVEVRDEDGVEWDVTLDADFEVLSNKRD